MTEQQVWTLWDLIGRAGFEWNMNSGIELFAQQTDQPPSKKRKQRGQGNADTATMKKHVSPKYSAKNDKGQEGQSAKMLDIRNRSISTRQDEGRGTDTKEESESGVKIVPV